MNLSKSLRKFFIMKKKKKPQIMRDLMMVKFLSKSDLTSFVIK